MLLHNKLLNRDERMIRDWFTYRCQTVTVRSRRLYCPTVSRKGHPVEKNSLLTAR